MRFNFHRVRPGLMLLLFLGANGTRVPGEDWPEFRGPTGQGHSEARGLPDAWSESQNISWKTPVPGTGWSSPVIWGDQIWLTSASVTKLDPEDAEARIAEAVGDEQVIPLQVDSDLQMRAICIDRHTGKIVHDILAAEVPRPDPIHTMNSYASPTPVVEAGRVYCHFGTNGTAAIDTATGEIAWRNKELQLKHETGPGSSPILWNNLLIVHCDGSDVQFIVALDKHDGHVVWRTKRTGKLESNPQFKKAYGTPIIVPSHGRELLISPAANWVYAYEPLTGRELWKVSYEVLGFSNVPRPIVKDGRLFVCTGFMKSELLALDLADDDPAQPPVVVWRFGKQVPQIPSPLLIGNELYFVSDQGGVFTCVDATSGELIYRERLGSNFASSPIHADGKIYLSDREGVTHVIRPGRKFELLKSNLLDEGCLASPAAVDGALYLRTTGHLYRIALGTARTARAR